MANILPSPPIFGLTSGVLTVATGSASIGSTTLIYTAGVGLTPSGAFGLSLGSATLPFNTLFTNLITAPTSALTIDSTSNGINIGTSTAGGVAIGRPGVLVTFPGGTLRATTPINGASAVNMQFGPGNGASGNGAGNAATVGGTTTVIAGAGGNGDAVNTPAAGANTIIQSGNGGTVGGAGGSAISGNVILNVGSPSGGAASGVIAMQFAGATKWNFDSVANFYPQTNNSGALGAVANVIVNAFITNTKTNNVDSLTATNLLIGGTTATNVQIGAAGNVITVATPTIQWLATLGNTIIGWAGAAAVDTAGSATTIKSQAGGAASVTGGGTAGTLAITAANGGNGTGALNPGIGGGIAITAGAAGTGGTGNANAGNVNFNILAASGTGVAGQVIFQDAGTNTIFLSPKNITFFPNTDNTGSIGTAGHTWATGRFTSTLSNSLDTLTATTLLLGTGTATGINIGGAAVVNNINVQAARFAFSGVASAAGTIGFSIQAANHTAITAGTDLFSFYSKANSATWATGALAAQLFNFFEASTINFAGASTATSAATVAIQGAPVAGTNATITNSYSLWVQAGLAKFDGGISSTTLITSGNITAPGFLVSSTTGFDTSTAAPLNLGAGTANSVVVGNITATTNFVAQDGTGNFAFKAGNAATSGSQLINTPSVSLWARYWNGTTSTVWAADLYHVMESTTPSSHLSVRFNSIEMQRFTSTGNFLVTAGQGIDTLAAGTLNLGITTANQIQGGGANNAITQFTQNRFTVTQNATASSSVMTIVGGAMTNVTAGTEVVDVNFGLARIVQHATGAIALQRSVLIQAPTYSFVAASTITDAVTLEVSGAPAAGTNATLTNTWAFRALGNSILKSTSGNGIFQLDDVVGAKMFYSINGINVTSTTTLNAVQGVSTSGSPRLITATGGAHTTLTASVEASDVFFNLNRTVQFSTGNFATQRAFIINAPTYGFVGASTITTAATFAISGPPVAGANATLSASYAMWIQSGTSLFAGNIAVDADNTRQIASAAVRLSSVNAVSLLGTNVDQTAAGALNVGTSVATSVVIAASAVPTQINSASLQLLNSTGATIINLGGQPLTLQVATPGVDTAAGTFTILGGAPGVVSAASGKVGGTINITAAAGANATAGFASGGGGPINITGGSGGGGSGAFQSSNGGFVGIAGGNGGASGGSGTTGSGSNCQISGGNGGIGSGTSGGGGGGSGVVNGGNGGGGTASASSGVGGGVSITAGTSGSDGGAGIAAGGGVGITGGAGNSSAGVSVGGAGGPITIISGTPGTGANGSNGTAGGAAIAGGAGGLITIKGQVGAAGANGGTGTTGAGAAGGAGIAGGQLRFDSGTGGAGGAGGNTSAGGNAGIGGAGAAAPALNIAGFGGFGGNGGSGGTVSAGGTNGNGGQGGAAVVVTLGASGVVGGTGGQAGGTGATGGTGGIGAQVTIAGGQGGPGGAANGGTVGIGGAGGTISITAGQGGNNQGNGGGQAGVVNIVGGIGSASSGASIGTAGGNVVSTGGVGGAASSSGSAGAGGNATINGGGGGAGNTSIPGATGGSVGATGGRGGAGTATAASGNGGIASFSSGAGNDNGGGGAGIGGTATYGAGKGGNGGATTIGGAGGQVVVLGGLGGTANTGSGGGGAGGATSIAGGTGGAGSSTALPGVGATLTVAGGAAGANGGFGGAVGGNLILQGGLGTSTNGAITIGAAQTSSIVIGAAGTNISHGQGTITQITSITTGVTLNASSGVITTVSSTIAASGTATFTVTNSCITTASVITLQMQYTGTLVTNGIPIVFIGTVSAGSFTITIVNIGTNALNNTMKIHFQAC